MRYRVLGGPVRTASIRGTELGGRKQRQILALLLSDAPHNISDDRLIEGVWGAEAPAGARRALQTHISELRKILPDEIRRDGAGYRLDVDPEQIDAHRFEQAATEGRSLLASSPARAARLLTEALELWEGEPYSDLEDSPLLEPETQRLHEVRLSALEDRTEADLALGRHLEVVDELEPLTKAHPFRERLTGLRMLALYRAGRQADALRTYDILRKLLATELGIDPSPELQRLEGAILRQDAELERGAARPRAMEEPPIPPPLAGRGVFVGRGAELRQLGRAWKEVSESGRRAAAWVSGEAGIGKTALCAQLAQEVSSKGGVVLYGRCDEDLGVPYQPIAQMATTLVRHLHADGIDTLPNPGELVRLVPEITNRFPHLPPPVEGDAGEVRWALLESVAALFALASSHARMLCVVDDLHWGAQPSLMMVRHILRSEHKTPILFVGAYRDTDLDPAHPLKATLADLRRDQPSETIHLAGLDREEIEAWVEADSETSELLQTGLVDVMARETAGNPLFVQEVLRHLADTGSLKEARVPVDPDDLGLPEGVRETVLLRLSRLPEPTNRALRVGAVAGPEFSTRLLEAVPDAGPAEALPASLDEAVQGGLIADHNGAYAFTHALVRRTIVDSLTHAGRTRLHRQIGEALEVEAPAELDALAYHFAQGAAAGCANKAADHALAAARRARERAAYEDAVDILERGLDALVTDLDRVRRCDLLIELARVQELLNSDDQRETVLRALDDGRATGSTERFVEAMELYPKLLNVFDEKERALVHEALDRTAGSSPELRAAALGMKASLDHRWGRHEDATHAAEAAAGLDPEIGEHAMSAWRSVASTVAGPSEMSPAFFVPRGQGEMLAYLSAGDWDAFDKARSAIAETSKRTGAWYAIFAEMIGRLMGALVVGAWDDAEDALAELASRGGDDPDVLSIWSANYFMLHRERGRHHDVLPAVEDAAQTSPLPVFRAGCATYFAELGRLEDARSILEDLGRPGLPGIPRNQTWQISLTLLAETAAWLANAEAARIIWAHLERQTGLLSAPFGGMVIHGAVDRFLGMLATTLGRYDEAEEYFDNALALEERLHSRPLRTRTRLWYGKLLLARQAEGDASRARTMLGVAVTEASELGMTTLEAQIRSELDGVPAGRGT